MEPEEHVSFTPEEWVNINKGMDVFFGAISKSFESWENTRKKNEDLLTSSYNHIGKIILCHLVIENLINNTLMHLKDYDEKKLSSLRFYRKLKELPKDKNKLYNFLIPGVEQLNTIRNRIAHNLNHVITEEEMKAIDIYLKFFKIKNHQDLTIEMRIEEFTNICIALFSLSTREVSNPWKELSKDHGPFLDQLKEIGRKVNSDSLNSKLNLSKDNI